MDRTEISKIIKIMQILNDIIYAELGVRFDDLTAERKLKLVKALNNNIPIANLEDLDDVEFLATDLSKETQYKMVRDALNKKADVVKGDVFDFSPEGDVFGLTIGDCLHAMVEMPDESVDLILTDLPYGTTRNKWDKKIDMESFFSQAVRILKPMGNIVLTGNGGFTYELLKGVIETEGLEFKHKLVWVKDRNNQGSNIATMPMTQFEDIIVGVRDFKGATYNNGDRSEVVRKYSRYSINKLRKAYGSKPDFRKGAPQDLNRDVLMFNKITDGESNLLEHGDDGKATERSKNNTQKPLDLLFHLITIYSNPGDLVFDATCGSGSTGVASILAGRRFYGCELNGIFAEIVLRRAEEALNYIAQGIDPINLLHIDRGDTDTKRITQFDQLVMDEFGFNNN